MRIFILLFAMFLSQRGFTDDTLLVKINERECLKCFAAQIAINKLSTSGTKIKLVFKNSNIDVNKFRQVNLPGLNDEVSFIVNDSIYSLINNDEWSELYLLEENGRLQFQCKMQDIWKYMKTIDNHKKLTVCELADSINTSFNVIHKKDGIYSLLDPMQQEVFLFDESCNLLKHIDQDIISVEEILTRNLADSTAYNNYINIIDALQTFGRDKPEIKSTLISDSLIHLMMNVPYPLYSNDTNISVFQKTVMVRVNIKTDSIIFFTIDSAFFNKKALNINPSDFSYDPSEDKYLFLTFPVRNDETCELTLVEGSVANHEISISKYIDFNLDSIFQSNCTQIYPQIVNNFLYFQFTNFLINIEDHKLHTTPFKAGSYTVDNSKRKVFFDYNLADLYIQDSLIHFLYSDMDNTYYYSNKRMDENDELENKAPLIIDIDSRDLKGNIQFISDKALIYIDKQNILQQYTIY